MGSREDVENRRHGCWDSGENCQAGAVLEPPRVGLPVLRSVTFHWCLRIGHSGFFILLSLAKTTSQKLTFLKQKLSAHQQSCCRGIKTEK